MATDNLLPFLLQNALSRAYPSAPSSNQVLYQFSLETDNTALSDTASATTVPLGYPYGYGESIAVNQSTPGVYPYYLTEPAALYWLIKMSAYIPNDGASSVEFQLQQGTSQVRFVMFPPEPLSPISPAQASWYADVYQWSSASYLGVASMQPWGTPSNWSDAAAWWIGPDVNAVTSDAPGQWLLRKWIYCAGDTYTVYVAADNQANVYIDGVHVVASTSSSTTTSATVSLTSGMHLVTVEMLNYGTAPNPTGLLISIQDSQGNIAENGSSQQWETTGYINRPWSYSSGAPLLTDTWYMVAQPTSTSANVTLTLSGSATVNNLWWYSVAPWKWDEGGQYDATANTALPITVTTVDSQQK